MLDNPHSLLIRLSLALALGFGFSIGLYAGAILFVVALRLFELPLRSSGTPWHKASCCR